MVDGTKLRMVERVVGMEMLGRQVLVGLERIYPVR